VHKVDAHQQSLAILAEWGKGGGIGETPEGRCQTSNMEGRYSSNCHRKARLRLPNICFSGSLEPGAQARGAVWSGGEPFTCAP